LTSALDGGEWSVSRRRLFARRERAHGSHWVVGWMGPKAGLDAVSTKTRTPRSSSPWPSAKLLSYPIRSTLTFRILISPKIWKCSLVASTITNKSREISLLAPQDELCFSDLVNCIYDFVSHCLVLLISSPAFFSAMFILTSYVSKAVNNLVCIYLQESETFVKYLTKFSALLSI